ncbi:hypothetical protein VD0002_g2534 [Verticillium dahliae]|uniref:alpha-glucosidase n=2 Tax=Verticillium dahliae TaxID=27337 RepID=G2XAY1_VERDV|nr:glycoside hydrolase [Verticillium dahliae VdLs.17]KAF3349195.1 Trafficking protein particle complex subunit 2-like protein [Verticillium dahliae VDG2]KAH6702725.1 glycoside hydrolase [Verticillium dahliae]EGY16196.1 glycoside hydrolase [Verticillium dahliae VdLs.17]PNH30164.1 hypothetical protein BJF96_g6642 [Verticillium dahliae]PNH48198.1 hypothetical protein VD0004_g328 [Verticillium dahliae]
MGGASISSTSLKQRPIVIDSSSSKHGMDKYKFLSDPVAHKASTITGSNYRFTVIKPSVLRYEWSPDGTFEDRASTFAINRKFDKPDYSVKETEDLLEIVTPSLHLSYDKKRFSPNGFLVTFINKATLWGSEWRYGGEHDGGNLGGTARTLDGVNGRCDMGDGILSRSGFANLDDSESMLFDGEGFVAPRKSGDRIDGYLFSYGQDYKGAMRDYHDISGKQPLVPRWALGNWWSRYHAYNDKEYLDLMDKFQDQKIPLSTAVIDMDWHLVHEEQVTHTGWTGYTWNKSLFPDHVAFCKDLHERHLKITLNDHPHAGVHHFEDLYEKVAKAMGYDTSDNAPILFTPTDPNFMHAFLNVLHRSLEEDGCDFWWIDWQQGPYSRIPGLDPLWLLNHFQYLDDSIQRNGSGAIIFSRYGGPGSHRYPVGFSGDSISTWESLAFQPEFTATASNVGYGWWSHDIGGHVAGSRDDELATRWTQYGVFSPIMRLHSSNSEWMGKEPWGYRDEYAAILRHFMRLRHRLVPYIYTMNVNAAASDEPLVQPLYWSHPGRGIAYDLRNQYTFGSSLVVRPVTGRRDTRTNLASEKVWVPPGRHVDIFNGYVYDGDREINMYRPLQSFPALAREGAIIPLDKALEPKNGCFNPEGYEVLVVVGQDGEFTIIEDSKDDSAESSKSTEATKERHIKIEWNQKLGHLKTTSKGKQWKFNFLSVRTISPTLSVVVDGLETPDVVVTTQTHAASSHTPYSMTVELPKLPNADCTILVDLGPDPQLGVIDRNSQIHAMLQDAQIDYGTKDRIWSIVRSSEPASTKVGKLMTLNLDGNVLGPVLEVLFADSREA